jgi:hypothetical protein
MKSFSQFLQESYLSEEETRQGKLFTSKDKPQDFRNPKKIPFTGTDPTPTPVSKRLSPAAPEAPKTSLGQLEIPEPKTTKVAGSNVRGAGEARQGSLLTKSGGAQNFTGGKTPFVGTEPVKATKRLPEAPTKAPKTSPGQQVIRQTSNRPTTKALPPVGQTSAPKPTSSAIVPAGKPPTGPKIKVPAGAKGLLRGAGKLVGPASAALDVADERSKGSGWLRSLAKGATVAAGGALGGAAGSVAGPVGTIGGATAGSMAASKAFDVAAGANAKERKAIATANRQSQSGGALKGIGGKTTFDTKKNTITTGTGTQRRTAQLGKTSVVTGPGGKQDVGYLAYKGGKAVYKRADTKSLAQTSSNPLERIGRSLCAGAYKQSDAANAAKKLATARQSDAARNKALGVKMKPGG